MHLATIRCNCAPAAALDVDYYVADFRLTPPPRIFNFFPNFKCLWGPPRLVRSSSPSGYIHPWSPPVAYWVGLFIFFQSVFWETHYCTLYSWIGFQDCKAPWETNGPYCYLWSNKAKTWDDAGQTCRREGGYLASVTSNAINDYILKEGAIKRISDSIWIGDLFR